MNPTGKTVSLAYALLLVVCACSAALEVWGFAFGIGDGDGKVGLATGTLMLGTLIGAAGLLVASLFSWTRWRSAGVIALASSLAVLPSAVLWTWLEAPTDFSHSLSGVWHPAWWQWFVDILPPFLGLAAMWLSWIRFQSMGRATL